MVTAPKMPEQRVGGQNWSRRARAQTLEHLRRGRAHGGTQSSVSQTIGVPRGTVQYWAQRQEQLGGNRVEREFFGSVEGVDFLHRLMVAVHTVFGADGTAGVRRIQTFVELTGLDAWVANSVGSQHAFSRQVAQALVQYGAEQQPRLARRMPPKRLCLVEDETFRAFMCLVAMEPVSGFILAECAAKQRDAATWNRTVAQVREQWPQVTFLQVTSDEAPALLSHTQSATGLNAHHSPDVFHVEHEAGQGLLLPLATQTRRERETLAELRAAAEQVAGQELATLQGRLALAQARVAAAAERQERARLALQGISEAYHPFDLKTGQDRTAEQVEQELHAHLHALEQLSEEAGLSAKAGQHVDKARRVVPAMVGTVTFVHETISKWLTEAALPVEQVLLLRKLLIPATYLTRCAQRAPHAEAKQALHQRAAALMDGAQRLTSWAQLKTQTLAQCLELALQCADLFQRSSSCVEGRNGQLSLYQHGGRALSEERLAVLTVLHNYFHRREDGTTAAERFSGHKPDDPFEYLLRHVPVPSAPAKGHKRTSVSSQTSR